MAQIGVSLWVCAAKHNLFVAMVVMLMILTACSSDSSYEIVDPGEFKVQASSGLMKSQEKDLVQRIEIIESEIEDAFVPQDSSSAQNAFGRLLVHRNHSGEVDGVEVQECEAVCSLFGLRPGDIVISAQSKKVQSNFDVELVTDYILRDGGVVLEIIRSGITHKIYCRLAAQGKSKK